MTTYAFDDAELAKLKDKTILIIGASSGIGLETVKLAHRHGAKVAVGDWNDAAGQALASELKESGLPSPYPSAFPPSIQTQKTLKQPASTSRVLFRKCDVSSWPDVLSLFQAAHSAFGPLDAVLSNAGINREDFLADSFDSTTGELLPPDLKVLDVNLVGAVYAVKCAVHFFAKRQTEAQCCQIVLTGSAASFLDTPPLHLYCASKAGVLGLMRGLRTQLVRKNITINMVAPWMTKTAMTRDLTGPWVDERKLPANEPEGVARALLLPVVRPDINGKSLFVAGDEIIELEDKLHESQPIWMGEELSKNVDEGQRMLISATGTTFTPNC